MKSLGSSSDRSKVAYKLFLPIWRSVVFVDWFGVLSTELFWHSILSRNSHPRHSKVGAAVESLFRQRPEVVKRWMRGEIDARTVVSGLGLAEVPQLSDEFMVRRLHEDCRKMSFRQDLIKGIQTHMPHSHILIATDNMDCFASQVPRMLGLCREVDDVLVSSNLGVLKTENVRDFFGRWLTDHQLSFQHALLIDDNARTCDAFRALGGHAILFTSVQATLDLLNQMGQTVEQLD